MKYRLYFQEYQPTKHTAAYDWTFGIGGKTGEYEVPQVRLCVQCSEYEVPQVRLCAQCSEYDVPWVSRLGVGECSEWSGVNRPDLHID
jgi:hypothetical protein